MQAQLELGDFDHAFSIYTTGGNSKSYAQLTVPVMGFALNKGAIVTGVGLNGTVVTGRVKEAASVGATTLLVTYHREARRASHASGCFVGGLAIPTTAGCFDQDWPLRAAGSVLEPVAIANKNGRTLQDFSTSAQSKMYMCGARCPYKQFDIFYQYFGHFDYADRWVTAALRGFATDFIGDGNANFSVANTETRRQAAQKGSLSMNVWMNVVREFEDAIGDCIEGSIARNDGAVHAWDEGVAFYTGSLEGWPVGQAGVMLHALADTRCIDFKTCGASGMARLGTSKVNLEMLGLFNQGQHYLLTGQCTLVESIKDRIVSMMTVPLIQSTLLHALAHALQLNPTSPASDKASGAVFATSVLPIIASCSKVDAATIFSNMRIDATATNFTAVKAAFERNYACIGIQCDDVGGVWDGDMHQFFSGAAPCIRPPPPDNSLVVDNLPAWGLTIIVTMTVFGLTLGCLGAFVVHREQTGKPLFANLTRQLTEAQVQRAADSRLNHVIKGLCGSALSNLTIFANVLPQHVSTSLPPDLEQALEGVQTSISEAVEWCHERQFFLQLERNTYTSVRTETHVVFILQRLLQGKGMIMMTCRDPLCVDSTVLRIVLAEAISNAITYGDPITPLRCQIALEGSMLSVRLININREGVKRLSAAQCAAVFMPGFKVHAVSSTSDGVGLDTALKATTAAAGRVSLSTEKTADGRDCTIFNLSLPVLPTMAGHTAVPIIAEQEVAGSAIKCSQPLVPTVNGNRTDVARPATHTTPPASIVAPSTHGTLFCAGIDDSPLMQQSQELLFRHVLKADMEKSRSIGTTIQEQLAFTDFAFGIVDAQLQPLPSPHCPADIVVLDQNIATDLLGSQLASELRSRGFQGVVCILTGSTGAELEELRALAGVDIVHSKGYDPYTLSAELREVLLRRTRDIGAAEREEGGCGGGDSGVNCFNNCEGGDSGCGSVGDLNGGCYSGSCRDDVRSVDGDGSSEGNSEHLNHISADGVASSGADGLAQTGAPPLIDLSHMKGVPRPVMHRLLSQGYDVASDVSLVGVLKQLEVCTPTGNGINDLAHRLAGDALCLGACELGRLAKAFNAAPTIEGVEVMWRTLDATRQQLVAEGLLPKPGGDDT